MWYMIFILLPVQYRYEGIIRFVKRIGKEVGPPNTNRAEFSVLFSEFSVLKMIYFQEIMFCKYNHNIFIRQVHDIMDHKYDK